jgi:DNA-binding NtrC family response regulator
MIDARAALEFQPGSIPDSGVDLNAIVSEVEDRLIDLAMGQASGNKTLAARLLRINRTTLVEKLRARGLIKSRNGKAARAAGGTE